jgi:hypothetical protein
MTSAAADPARKWDDRYQSKPPAFEVHPLVDEVLGFGLPVGSAVDIACGRSGNALALAARGIQVTCVDISGVALDQLMQEARRRRLADLIRPVQADLDSWQPGPDRYGLVLCTYFWTAPIFRRAIGALVPNGLVAWESFEVAAAGHGAKEWKIRAGEPASLLSAHFEVLIDEAGTHPGHGPHVRRFVARHRRRRAVAGTHRVGALCRRRADPRPTATDSRW